HNDFLRLYIDHLIIAQMALICRKNKNAAIVLSFRQTPLPTLINFLKQLARAACHRQVSVINKQSRLANNPLHYGKSS
ncbi:hypothetical protein QQ41_09375, partial [Streptococcus equi subsp. zooepidemicus]